MHLYPGYMYVFKYPLVNLYPLRAANHNGQGGSGIRALKARTREGCVG